MVERLHDLGAFKSERVAAAVATVPRHVFAPGESLEAAYAPDNPLTVKSDSTGAALSSVSATHLQVVMLEQAAIEPGMRVMEVGSGVLHKGSTRQPTSSRNFKEIHDAKPSSRGCRTDLHPPLKKMLPRRGLIAVVRSRSPTWPHDRG
ncbi:hypothetical protein [Actinocorallia sp. API 0066]|uniref:hypothetical protein n=1 Tax=Actinocorallia sp. API 0066 TaxID=2896846 RepID=UPI0035AC215F